MAEIVNLRTMRKRKEREQKADVAAQNRITFGRTKAEKTLSEAQSDQASRRLDGHKLGDESDG